MSDEKKPKSPFGNLSFEEYTFETEAEKLVLALHAAMQVEGLAKKSKPIKTVIKLKRAMAKTKRYSFDPIPRAKKNEENNVEIPEPDQEQANLVAQVMAHCFGLTRKKWSARGTSAGLGIVRGVYAGKLDELRIPPNPDYIVTEDRARREVAERCFTRDSSLKDVRVLSVQIKKNSKKNKAVVVAEAVFR